MRHSEQQEEGEGWRYELKWVRRHALAGGGLGKSRGSGRGQGEQKARGSWLVLSDRSGCGSALLKTLEKAGKRGVRVMAGRE